MTTGLAVALVLAWAPRVSVDVEPPDVVGEGVDPALERWLVKRVLEEGVEVTPRPAEADAHPEAGAARPGARGGVRRAS